MKVNIKGLAFVGFAAAIFAASAHADTAEEIAAKKKTVTSQYYAEQTYQTLANKMEQGEATTNKLTVGGTNVDDTHYPTAKAVAQALALQPGSAAYTGSDGVTVTDHNITNSGIRDVTATDANGANGTITINKNGTTSTVAVKGLQDTAFTQTTTNTALAESAKIPTAGTVKSYVDGQITTANLTQYQVESAKVASIDDSEEATNNVNTTNYASTAAVTGWAQKKIPAGTAGKLVTYSGTAGTVSEATLGTGTLTVTQNGVSAGTFGANATGDGSISIAAPDWNQATAGAADFIKNKPGAFTAPTTEAAGTQGFVPAPAANTQTNVLRANGWDTVDTAVTPDSTHLVTSGAVSTAISGAITTANLTQYQTVANKVTTIDNNSDDTHYPSAAAVYSYVSALPAINVPNTCTDAAPCALVATTSGAAWVNMAQSN